jgi:hypothetical protein
MHTPGLDSTSHGGFLSTAPELPTTRGPLPSMAWSGGHAPWRALSSCRRTLSLRRGGGLERGVGSRADARGGSSRPTSPLWTVRAVEPSERSGGQTVQKLGPLWRSDWRRLRPRWPCDRRSVRLAPATARRLPRWARRSRQRGRLARLGLDRSGSACAGLPRARAFGALAVSVPGRPRRGAPVSVIGLKAPGAWPARAFFTTTRPKTRGASGDNSIPAVPLSIKRHAPLWPRQFSALNSCFAHCILQKCTNRASLGC